MSGTRSFLPGLILMLAASGAAADPPGFPPELGGFQYLRHADGATSRMPVCVELQTAPDPDAAAARQLAAYPAPSGAVSVGGHIGYYGSEYSAARLAGWITAGNEFVMIEVAGTEMGPGICTAGAWVGARDARREEWLAQWVDDGCGDEARAWLALTPGCQLLSAEATVP